MKPSRSPAFALVAVGGFSLAGNTQADKSGAVAPGMAMAARGGGERRRVGSWLHRRGL